MLSLEVCLLVVSTTSLMIVMTSLSLVINRSVTFILWCSKGNPDINKGKIRNYGFELEIRFNKVLANGMRFWANTNYTYAHNDIK